MLGNISEKRVSKKVVELGGIEQPTFRTPYHF
jgi:hypothetical protein